MNKWSTIYASQEIPFSYSIFGSTLHIPQGTEGTIVEVDIEDPQYTYKIIFLHEDAPAEGLWVSEEMITDAN